MIERLKIFVNAKFLRALMVIRYTPGDIRKKRQKVSLIGRPPAGKKGQDIP